MLRNLAIALSVLMHPLLMPTSLFAVLFYYAPVIVKPLSQEAARYVLLAIFVTTFVLPMVSITALRLSVIIGADKLQAFSMPEKKDRILPFFFTSLFYAITTYMFFSKVKISQVLVVVLATMTLVIAIISLITLFYKISACKASIGCWAGFLIGLGIKHPQALMFWPLIVALVLGGFLMSARLYLNAHKPSEILAGNAVGLGISLGAMLLYVP